ncbi:MAG: hypothetical protein ABR881_11530 [Candidatus Sulfotelmatobacter sp.]|jgi:hypothetical protein
MINEFEFYHGVTFARMLHSVQRELAIKPYSASDNAAYVVDGSIGVYIKYSSKRLSPWRFSFQQRHRDAIVEMKTNLGDVFVLLVCNDDGVVILTFDEFKQVLNEAQERTEWISATRNRREMYSIKGSDGKLGFKVGKDEFLGKLFSRDSLPPGQKGPVSC